MPDGTSTPAEAAPAAPAPATIEGPAAMEAFARETAAAPGSGGPGVQIVENIAAFTPPPAENYTPEVPAPETSTPGE